MYQYNPPDFYNVFSDTVTQSDTINTSNIIDQDNNILNNYIQQVKHGGDMTTVKEIPPEKVQSQQQPIQYQFTTYYPSRQPPQQNQLQDKPFIIKPTESILQPDKINLMTPVFNNITLNPNDPFQNHAAIAPVVEMMLPINNISSVTNTLKDRKLLINFIKSTLLFNTDGLIVDKNKYSIKRLFRTIKTVKLNPYVNPSTYGKQSPYDLPNNYIIYKSCFPIKNINNVIKCDKNSTFLNIKMYCITRGELINRLDESKISQSKALSEIAYYTYIKNNIINECPNFVLLCGYNYYNDPDLNFDAYKTSKVHNTSKVNIDIKEIEELNSAILVSTVKYYNSLGYNDILSAIPIKEKRKIYNSPYVKQLSDGNPIRDKVITYLLMKYFVTNDKTLAKQVSTKINSTALDKAYLNDFILAITESPSYNIYDWASTSYIDKIGVQSMVSTGMHSPYKWYSVIFQMLAAFSELLVHNIYIPDFSLANNVFIKVIPDIPTPPRVWKYNVNNIDYYVPNYGDFVMIDSSYTDTVENGGRISISNNEKNNKKMYELLTECLNPMNFVSSIFITKGGITPDSEVMKLFGNLYSFCKSNYNKNIFKDAINNNIFIFCNNRVGTYLTDDEYKNISSKQGMQLSTTTRTGQFIIYPDNNKYKIGIYINTQKTQQDKIIIGGGKFEIRDIEECINKVSLDDTSAIYSLINCVNIICMNICEYNIMDFNEQDFKCDPHKSIDKTEIDPVLVCIYNIMSVLTNTYIYRKLNTIHNLLENNIHNELYKFSVYSEFINIKNKFDLQTINSIIQQHDKARTKIITQAQINKPNEIINSIRKSYKTGAEDKEDEYNFIKLCEQNMKSELYTFLLRIIYGNNDIVKYPPVEQPRTGGANPPGSPPAGSPPAGSTTTSPTPVVSTSDESDTDDEASDSEGSSPRRASSRRASSRRASSRRASPRGSDAEDELSDSDDKDSVLGSSADESSEDEKPGTPNHQSTSPTSIDDELRQYINYCMYYFISNVSNVLNKIKQKITELITQLSKTKQNKKLLILLKQSINTIDTVLDNKYEYVDIFNEYISDISIEENKQVSSDKIPDNTMISIITNNKITKIPYNNILIISESQLTQLPTNQILGDRGIESILGIYKLR